MQNLEQQILIHSNVYESSDEEIKTWISYHSNCQARVMIINIWLKDSTEDRSRHGGWMPDGMGSDAC